MTAKPMVSIFFFFSPNDSSNLLTNIAKNLSRWPKKKKSPFCKLNKVIKVLNHQRFKRKFTGWFSVFLTWKYSQEKQFYEN